MEGEFCTKILVVAFVSKHSPYPIPMLAQFKVISNQ